MKLNRARTVRGELRLPGDKSISHRAALIGALASGVSKFSNFSTAVDCSSTLSCLMQLGVQVERDGNHVWIQGAPELRKSAKVLDCGNSGSTIRMLAGVLAAQDFASELSGDSSLNSRPMRRIIEPLELMGATIQATGGKPPLVIHGTKAIRPINYKLPVASAQVKSAILFAALGAEGRTEVHESSLSRDHTERMFNGFGVEVTTDEELTVTLKGPAQLIGSDMTIPGDVSSAAYFIAAAVLLPQSDLVIHDVGLNPTRSEFISVLRSCGADISTGNVRDERNEPMGRIQVKGGIQRSANEPARCLEKSKIPALIDELPLLAVVGTQLDGGIEIHDAGELRHKETDRLRATAENLRKMGAEVIESPDGLVVSGPTRLRGATINSYGDHRIAMAFAIAALVADGATEIVGADCVRISFPEFFELLKSVSN
ncbi:MAG TPA: 3-phosphoshikimate 1-carboxyvinyltransferase [Pyrinomonadaceae bacterium]